MTSDFPVILSFENHCSKKQQEKLARHCERIFGSLLLNKPFENYPVSDTYPLDKDNNYLVTFLFLKPLQNMKPLLEQKNN